MALGGGSSEEYLASLGIDFSQADRAIEQTITLLAALGDQFPQVANKASAAERALGGYGRAQQTAAKGATQVASATEIASKQNAIYNQYLYDQQRAQDKAAASAGKAAQSQLPRLRYALYDVSYAAAISGAALAAGGIAAEATAVEYEKAFADVQRTSDGLTDNPGLAALRQQLLDITTSIPQSFGDVAKIATLGNQLGIASGDIASFTRTVAEFSSTTNVGVEDSATAFGRLGQLLHTTDYRGLGDDIAYLGVKSVATESQIIKTAQQIAVSGNAAGFSEKQVLALSTAVASLGVKPEQARGTFVRVFADINRAVAQPGDTLNELARISGESSSQFSADWKTDASGAFTKFITGLSASGSDVAGVLAELGVTAVRDQQTIGLLAQNTDVLASAQDNATKSAGYLDKAYDVLGSTTAARLQVLQNSVLRVFDDIGQQQNGPAKDALNGLISLLGQLDRVLQDPLAAGGVAITATLAAIVGGGLIAIAMFLRLAATMIAIKTAGVEAGQSQGVLATAIDAVFSRGAFATRSNIALAASENQLAASGVAAAAGQDAASASGAGLAASGARVGSVLGKAGLVGSILALLPLLPALGSAISEGASAMVGQRQDAEDLATAIQNLGTQYDDLARKQLGNQLTGLNPVTHQGLTTPISYRDQRKDYSNMPIGAATPTITGTQAYYNKVTTGSATGRAVVGPFTGGADINAAETDAETRIKAYDAALAQLASSGNLAAVKKGISEFDTQLKGSGLSTDKLNKLLPQTTAALGGAAGASVDSALAAQQSAAATDDQAQSFSDIISDAFGASNAAQSLAGDMESLGEAFVNNGADAASSGSELQKVVEDIYNSAGSAPQAAAEMQGLFNELVSGGYASASQLSGLQAVIDALTNGQGSLTAINIPLTGFTNGIAKATKAVGGGGGGGGGGLTKAVKTLADYANDLGGVIKRAFDIRFGPQQGLDDIASKWADIAKNVSQAQQDMAQYQAQLDQLTADKATQQYWLSVAQNYGDALRAGELTASLADIDSQITDTTGKLTDAQDQQNKTLVGNSSAAIQNRSDILGLVQSYESYIQSLAASGANQATLSATAAQLKSDFIAQATQLGYNTNELGTYAAAFDDVTTSINGVPRNITVTANTDPAVQALNEFVAKAAQAGASAGQAFNNGFSTADVSKAGRAAAVYARIAGLAAQMLPSATTDSQISRNQNIQNQIAALNAQLASGSYASGGWTGNGGINQPAGIVHGREFVLNHVGAQMFSPQELTAANQGRRVAPTVIVAPGPKVMQVEFSPYDRELIAQGHNIQLTIAGDTLGAASQGSYTEDSRVGGS